MNDEKKINLDGPDDWAYTGKKSRTFFSGHEGRGSYFGQYFHIME